MLAELVVSPIGKQESLSHYVAEVVYYIKDQAEKGKIKYELTSMGTIIEGESNEVWETLMGAHNTMKEYSNRVYTIIHIDDRKGRDNTINSKKEKVEGIVSCFVHNH